jgi:hypothetical protein
MKEETALKASEFLKELNLYRKRLEIVERRIETTHFTKDLSLSIVPNDPDKSYRIEMGDAINENTLLKYLQACLLRKITLLEGQLKELSCE